MTLDAEEMERALKIENYFLDDQNKWSLEKDDDQNKWNLEEDKKLLLLRCQLLGKCQAADLKT